MEQTDPRYVEKKDEKAQAVAIGKITLAEIEAQGRQPDGWERVGLHRGIVHLAYCDYTGASKLFALTMTPAAERSVGSSPSSYPFYERLGIHTLRRTFDEVATWPLRATPDLSLSAIFQAQPEK